MLVDQTKVVEHYAALRDQLVRAIALTTPDTLTTCPVEFAMLNDLPVWAVKEARRRQLDLFPDFNHESRRKLST